MWQRYASLGQSRTLRYVKRAIFWSPTAFVLWEYFYRVRVVSGRSMQPTLNPDSSMLQRDVALFDRFSVHISQKPLERGDIVAVQSPIKPGQLLVKRVVALAGDTVQTLASYPREEVTIPQGHIWIEGDEPFHSDDSNRFGPVPLALVDSRMLAILWPLSRLTPTASSATLALSGGARRNAQLRRVTPGN